MLAECVSLNDQGYDQHCCKSSWRLGLINVSQVLLLCSEITDSGPEQADIECPTSQQVIDL